MLPDIRIHPKISVTLLRHGETSYNAERNRIGGRSNFLTLSDHGIQQARQCGRNWACEGQTFERIFCSPAVRTRQTLSLILEEAPYLTPNAITYVDEIQELSQGEWEGRLRSEIYTPELLQIINSNNWLFKAPGGESQKEVEERMMHFLNTQIAQVYIQGHFLVVGHGFSFKCLLRLITHGSPAETYKRVIENCAAIPLGYDEALGWFMIPD